MSLLNMLDTSHEESTMSDNGQHQSASSAGATVAIKKSKLTTVSEYGILGLLVFLSYNHITSNSDEDRDSIRESNKQQQEFVQQTVKGVTEALVGVKASTDMSVQAYKDGSAALIDAVQGVEAELDDVGDGLRDQGQGIDRQAAAFESLLREFHEKVEDNSQPVGSQRPSSTEAETTPGS